MASKLTQYKITCTTDGSGDCTAYSAGCARGNIKAIRIDFSSTAAATTDTTISDEYGQTILTLTDNNTDAWFYPRKTAVTSANAALTYDGTRGVMVEFSIFGRIKVVQAQGGDTKTNYVWVLVEEY